MNYTRLLVCLALVGFACSDVAAAQRSKQSGKQSAVRVPLQWQHGQQSDYGYQAIASSAFSPRGVTLPALLGEAPHFITIPFGDQQTLRVILELDGQSPMLWVDRDFDADFGDEQSVEWIRSKGAWHCTVDVTPSFLDDAAISKVSLDFRCRVSDPLTTLECLAQTHKSGSIVLADRLREIILVDESSALDLSAVEHVALVIDVDGDGFLATEHGSHEHFHAGESFQIGAEVWEYRVIGRKGASILLVPSEIPAERVKPNTQADVAWRPWPKPFVPPLDSVGVSVAALVAKYEQEDRLLFEERTSTVHELAAVGNRASFAMLKRIAETDKDPRLQRLAIRLMGRPEYLEAGSEWLSELALGAKPNLVEPALTALYLMRDPELGALLTKLGKSKRQVCVVQAALFLGYLESPQSIKAAQKLLKNEQTEGRRIVNPDQRRNAYRGLRTVLAGPSTDIMLTLLTDSDWDLRAMALMDLMALKSPYLSTHSRAAASDAVQGRSQEYLDAALIVLTASDEVANIQAAFNLVARNPWGTSQELAVQRLARFRSERAVGEFRKQLRSGQSSHQILAGKIFAAFKSQQGFDYLSKQLNSELTSPVAVELVKSIGENGSAVGLKLLISKARQQSPLRLAAIEGLGSFGLEHEEAREFLLGMLSSKYWQDQVLAIEAIAKSSEPAFALDLIPSLEHEHWPVRLAAIEALRVLRHRASISPLVAMLQEEEHLRLQKAAGQTLFMLTGQNPHRSPEAWLGWWENAATNFHMSDTIPQPRVQGGTVSKSTFYGLSLDSDHVVFVIDQSGSMAAPAPADEYMPHVSNRLEQALANAVRSVEVLKEDAMVNVVLFSTGVQRWNNELQVLNKKNRKSLMNFLDVQGPEGGTNLFDGLEFALKQKGVDRILLLSDGQPSAGRFMDTEDILREVRQLNRANRIAIDCVALGIESPLLKRLAAENEGRYIER
jgi:HEAT repeat protein